jgi:hypothetical protein
MPSSDHHDLRARSEHRYPLTEQCASLCNETSPKLELLRIRLRSQAYKALLGTHSQESDDGGQGARKRAQPLALLLAEHISTIMDIIIDMLIHL